MYSVLVEDAVHQRTIIVVAGDKEDRGLKHGNGVGKALVGGHRVVLADIATDNNEIKDRLLVNDGLQDRLKGISCAYPQKFA